MSKMVKQAHSLQEFQIMMADYAASILPLYIRAEVKCREIPMVGAVETDVTVAHEPSPAGIAEPNMTPPSPNIQRCELRCDDCGYIACGTGYTEARASIMARVALDCHMCPVRMPPRTMGKIGSTAGNLFYDPKRVTIKFGDITIDPAFSDAVHVEVTKSQICPESVSVCPWDVKPVAPSRVCDCGAVKAGTPHASWCSTCAA